MPSTRIRASLNSTNIQVPLTLALPSTYLTRGAYPLSLALQRWRVLYLRPCSLWLLYSKSCTLYEKHATSWDCLHVSRRINVIAIRTCIAHRKTRSQIIRNGTDSFEFVTIYQSKIIVYEKKKKSCLLSHYFLSHSSSGFSEYPDTESTQRSENSTWRSGYAPQEDSTCDIAH